MRKVSLFSVLILIILFSGACKGGPKPAPAKATDTNVPTTNVPTAQITTPTTNTPGAATIATTTPDTSSSSAYGTATGGTSGSVGSRHQSGIILDGATSYSVARGDTLSSIARRAYQDGSLYPLIMMVNTIADPDEIEPGEQYTIPNHRTNMNDPTAKQSINRYFLQIAQIEEQRGRSETAAMIRNHTR